MRQSEPEAGGVGTTTIVRIGEPGPAYPVDPERHALESRIEHAKTRIAEDVDRASVLVRNVARNVATNATKGLGKVGILLVVGIAFAGALAFAIIQRRHRVRLTWR